MRTYSAAALAQLAAQAGPCTVVVKIGKLYDPEGVIAGSVSNNLDITNAQVYPDTNSIRFMWKHALETGDLLTYNYGPNAGYTYYISPLTDGQSVYVIKLSDVEIQLATSYANALAGTAINITSGLSGAASYGIDPSVYAAVARPGTASGLVFTVSGTSPGWTTDQWNNAFVLIEAADAGHPSLVGMIVRVRSYSGNTANTFTTSGTNITGATQIKIIGGVDSDVGFFQADAFSSLPGNTDLGYFSNGPVTDAPAHVHRWLSGTMPGLQANYDEQKASLSMGGIQFDIDNKDGQFTKLCFATLGPGAAWHRREVYLYLLPTRAWSSALLVGRFLLKEPPKDQGLFYKFYTNDMTKLISGEIDQPEQKFKLRGVLKELRKLSGGPGSTNNAHTFTFNPTNVVLLDNATGDPIDNTALLVMLGARRLFFVCVEGTAPAGMLFRITGIGYTGTTTVLMQTVTCNSAVSGDNRLGGAAGSDASLKVTKGYLAYVPGSGDDAQNPVKDVMGFDYTGLVRLSDPVVNDGTLLDTDQKFKNASLETWSGSPAVPATPWAVSESHTGGAAACTLTKNDVLAYVYGGAFSAKLALSEWEPTVSTAYYQFQQNIMGTDAAGIAQKTIVAGCRVLCGDAELVPGDLVGSTFGLQAQAVFEYFTNGACSGSPAATFESGWQDNLGAQQVFSGDGAQLTDIVPAWTLWAQGDDVNPLVPPGTLSVRVSLRFRNRPLTAESQQPPLTDVYVDAFSCLIAPAGVQYEDTYVVMNREICAVDAIYADADTGKCWMSVAGRGQLGTLPCRHKRDAQGNIIRVVGGYDYTNQLTQQTYEGHPKAHPLNVLLALLTSTETVHSYYVPWLAAGRVSPVGRKPWRGNNVWYDSPNSRYYGWDVGYGWGMGIPLDYIDWQAICTLRDSAAYRGQMCEFRFKEGIKNFKEWSEEEIMRPFGYRWVLGLDGKLSVAPVVGDAYAYTPVDTIEERDMEGLPDVTFNNDVVNRVTWQFDTDLSETTDNAQNSKYISLHQYDESSFWSIPAGQSSKERLGLQDVTFKSLGLRGCVSSKFANGYDLGGDQVARMVTHDFLLRWRDQLPTLKMDVGLKYMPIDAGDIVYVKHSKLWDLDTGARWSELLGKKAQVTSVRHDYTKKKVTLDAMLLDRVPHPMTYYPALGSAMPTPRYSTAADANPCDLFIAHYDGDAAYEDMKNLDIRDYPFDISNLFFVCQTYGRLYSDLKDFLANTAGATSDLVHRRLHRVPTFTGYRHTVIRVYNALKADYVKVGEFNGPYAFFNWISDADTKTAGGQVAGTGVSGPILRISYASTNYDPATGLYEDGYALSKYITIDLSGRSFKGTDLKTRYEEQLRERRVSGRGYRAIGSPGENRR